MGEIVDGTGEPLGFGIDWTECGVVKFLRAQIVDALTPWLCALDYVTAEATAVRHPHQDGPWGWAGATSAGRRQGASTPRVQSH